MMIKKTLLAAAVFAMGGFAMTASAAIDTTFDVKINILASCSIAPATGSPINFDNVLADTVAGNAALTKSTALSVTCSKTTPYAIGLTTDTGTAGAGVMTGLDAGNSTDSIGYTLYQPGVAGAITTTVWGGNSTDPAAPGNDYASVGTGEPQSINVFATVTDPNHTPGNYSDTVTVDVYF